jgi:hypothetical protein
MHGIDERLGPGKGEPGEGVEKVVQIVRTRLDASGLEHTHFIISVGRPGRHKTQRPAALSADADFLREGIEPIERAGAEPPRPGAHGFEDRMV